MDQSNITDRGKLLYDESHIAQEEFIKWKNRQITGSSLLIVSFVIVILIMISTPANFFILPFVAFLFLLLWILKYLIMTQKAEPLKVYSNGIIFPRESIRFISKARRNNFERFDEIQWIYVPDRGHTITLFRRDGQRVNYYVLDRKRFVNATESHVQMASHLHYKED